MAATCCGQEQYEKNERPRNDRRLLLIDQIKRFIDVMEAEEHGRSGMQRRKEPQGPAGIRNMDRECLQYRKRRECSPPTITAISVHETRPTSNYTEMRHENSRQLTYVDASSPEATTPMPPAPWDLPRTPSQELRASTLYMNCDCLKRNGLQHDCPRWDCGGRPECVATNPGPCCETSKARKPVRGDRRYGGAAREAQVTPADTRRPAAKSPLASRENMIYMEAVIPVPSQQGVYKVTPLDNVSTQTPRGVGAGSSQTLVGLGPAGPFVCACVPQGGQVYYNQLTTPAPVTRGFVEGEPDAAVCTCN